MNDMTQQWCERVRNAVAERVPLCLQGGGTKAFYGRTSAGSLLDTRAHRGVVSYEPTELVVTVRGGTPLAELEAMLAAQNQFLAFEPPHFGAGATVAGAVAAGLSGPRRASAGAVRDFVLGVKIIDGRGEVLSFGGQVMKNVAGYDVSRAIAGSLGTLGLILEVSLKVLPRPVAEASLRFEMNEQEALTRLNEWGGQPLPLSASAWHDGVLDVRLSGAEAAVRAAQQRLGGERVAQDPAAAFWQSLREQSHPALAGDDSAVLWRLSVPSSAAPLRLAGSQVVEWGGAQRWLRTAEDAGAIRARAAALGGHAQAFRGGNRDGEIFHPLPAPIMAIHRRLKQAFDPAGVFNPGRLYDGF